MNLAMFRDFAWMSNAAYNSFRSESQINRGFLVEDLNKQALGDSSSAPATFTLRQARAFAGVEPVAGQSTYTLLGHQPNSASGFSASVFRNDQTGAVTLAIRGTEFNASLFNLATDLLNADLIGVGLQGVAKQQLADAYRLYKQLITPSGQSVAYTALELSTLHQLGASYVTVVPELSGDRLVPPSDTGNGALADSLVPFNLTGHSLGGHVALMLGEMAARLSGSADGIGQVVAFNAPGVGGPWIVQELRDWLGFSNATAASVAPKVINVFAEQGMTFTADLGVYVGAVVPAFIESETVNPIANHSMGRLADTLTAYSLLQMLDPTLPNGQVASILHSGSNQVGRSIEDAVGAVTRALGRTPSIADREALFNEFFALLDTAGFQSLAGKVLVTLVTSYNAPLTANTAKTDFGEFVALKTLSPFSLLPNGAVNGAADTLTNVWRSAHATDYAAWEADLAQTPQRREVGEGNVSDRWYTDRAEMLKWIIKANEDDIDYAANNGRITGQVIAQPTLFDDQTSGARFTVSLQPLSQDALGVRRVIFGRSDNATPQTIEGRDANDSLYGGSRSDILIGNDGQDYLEGGAGIDDLQGGSGDDILVGGADDSGDQLRGGKDNDTLIGGDGNDTYYITSGEGIDTIIDSDRLGSILWDSETLGGGLKLGESIWRSADGRFNYVLINEGDSDTLVISKSGAAGKVVVKHFVVNNAPLPMLGIALSDAPYPPPQPATDSLLNVPANQGFWPFYDTAGNDRITGTIEADQIVAVRGGNDLIVVGGPGELNSPEWHTWPFGAAADSVTAAAGDDYVFTGHGNDVVYAGFGSDWVDAGEGADSVVTGYDSANIDWWAWYLGDRPGPEPVLTPSIPLYYVDEQFYVRSPYGDPIETDTWALVGLRHNVRGIMFEWPWLNAAELSGQAGAPATDTVFLGGGSDQALGGYYEDFLFGDGGVDWLQGDGGDDVLDGGADADILCGDGPLTDIYMDEFYPLRGFAGNDILFGRAGGDILNGGAGNDHLDGGTDNDALEGGDGDDLLIGGHGDDRLDGAAGSDLYLYARGDGRDTINTFDAGDTLVLGGGLTLADVSVTRDASRLILDIAGQTVVAGAGIAFAQSAGDDESVRASAANSSDQIRIDWFGRNARGEGRIAFEDGTVLTAGMLEAMANDRVAVRGTAGDDSLNGSDAFDLIYGADGDDLLHGMDADDELIGGAGNDLLDGGGGADTLAGGDGDDTYVVDDTNDLIVDDGPGQGLDLVRSSANFVLTDAQHVERVELTGTAALAATGNAHANAIVGNNADNLIDGGAGGDALIGEAGDDVLLGRDGDDSLDGGDGNDRLYGGAGNDSMAGGAGDDVYLIDDDHGPDRIIDTASGSVGDVIELACSSNAVEVLRDGDDIVLRGWSLGSEIRVRWFDSPSSRIELIRFLGDSAQWDATEVESRVGLGFVVRGTPGDDQLYGTDNDDRIEGGAGNDSLIGNGGDDLMIGGVGDDFYEIRDAGDRVLELSAEGHDRVMSYLASYTLPHNVESLTLNGEAFEGIGNELPNSIFGSYLANRLDGAAGADYMVGRGGDDLYIVDDPGDIVEEDLTPLSGYDTIESSISLIGDDGGFRYRGPIESIVLTGAADIDAVGLSFAQLIRGNSGDNFLAGSHGDDTIEGGAGDDVLEATRDKGSNEGHRHGNDVLRGGEGDDTYWFGLWSGQDFILDESSASGGDRIRIASGVDPSAVHLRRDGLDLVLTIDGRPDTLRIRWFDSLDHRIESIEFANGVVWAMNADGTVADGSSGPVVANPIDGVLANEDVRLSFTVPADTFDNAEGATYSVVMIDGTALPAWLSFDKESRTLAGTPLNEHVGELLLRVTATDTQGRSAFGDFALTVANTNDAPTVAVPISNSVATEDAPFSLAVPIETFADVDVGDVVSLSASRDDGSALPVWLSFDAATRVFSGTPANGDVGSVQVRVTATDAGGGQAFSDFTLSIVNTNDEPIVASTIADQRIEEDAAFSFSVPPGGFVDVDAGDRLTLAATSGDGSALPAWLGFDPATQTFSGTPLNHDVGSVVVRVTAIDLSGSSAHSDFAITITNTNDPPLLIAPIDDVTVSERQASDFVVPIDAFADVDLGDPLAFTATLGDGRALPSWLAFDAATRRFTATPGEGDIGSVLVRVTATDLSGATASDEFLVSVTERAGQTLNGTAAADSINGTDGADEIRAGSGADLVNAGAGRDLVFGEGGNDVLDGGSGDDRIDGGDGADRLIGGTGRDTLIGAGGNDVFEVDDTGDLVLELPSGGIDAVESMVTYLLGSEIENLTLKGTAAIDGTGNALPNTILGNSGANTLDGGAGADTLRGGAGDDLYLIDNVSDRASENVGEGTDGVHALVSWTLGPNFENLRLTGDAPINGTGNGLANVITGNSGPNVLNGGAGADVMQGGAGDDTYVVDNVGDSVIELDSEGNDLVQASASYALPADVERLQLIGSGNIGGTGNTLANRIDGNSGNNRLDGGAGDDVLAGGGGNDTYVVDSHGDAIIESVAGGIDTVEAWLDYVLGTELENLTLIGSVAISATGNELGNTLRGNVADNRFDGKGGEDRMVGVAGNDVYQVDSAGDVIVEQANEGNDTVLSSVSYALPTNVETLQLTGVAAINASGNGAANTLIGNGGANVLDGAAGADLMRGGAGDDVYIVDNARDVIDEANGEGADTVRASVAVALGPNIENLTLTGSNSIAGTGNELANRIEGNSGDNRLNGGAGADLLVGGSGNDTYVVDEAGDMVVEASAGGIDTLETSLSITLAAEVENLRLTGTTAAQGTGNSLANTLQGNSGDNALFGLEGNDDLRGGAGNDVLQGGEGADVLADHSGSSLLDGGIGEDLLNGGANRSLFVGGRGSDSLTLGGGVDVIAFNRGDGADRIAAPTVGAGLNETNDTLSLGGIRYSELRLAREGADLLVKVAGTADSIRLVDWYAATGNHTMKTLQLMVDTTADYDPGGADSLASSRVVRLHFAALVNAFDVAYTADSAIGDWAIPVATFSSSVVGGSDTLGIGGDLAYRYAHDGDFAGIDFLTAANVLSSTTFGTSPQAFSLQPTSGGVRLMSWLDDSVEAQLGVTPVPDDRQIAMRWRSLDEHFARVEPLSVAELLGNEVAEANDRLVVASLGASDSRGRDALRSRLASWVV